MFTIRNVSPEDIGQLVVIENLCFTKAEAATKEAFERRIETISDTFLVAEENGELVGLINGPVISKQYIYDDLFSNIQQNPKQGGHQTILGLAVLPTHQKRGIAKALLSQLEKIAVAHHRKSVTLTCLERLTTFYEPLGYSNRGLSTSSHGGETWFNMSKDLF